MELDYLTLIIFITGIFAGFVDAVAGGGGLITIPALMLYGLPANVTIATNKLVGTAGALMSSMKYATAGKIDWSAYLYMGITAGIGSIMGSRLIGKLPMDYAENIVVVMLIAITIFVIVKPELGMNGSQGTTREEDKKSGQPLDAIVKLAFFGLIIGFHDGFFGPGTGTFFVFVLLTICSLDFLMGTGTAKILNLTTNIIALVIFLRLGLVNFAVGIPGVFGSAIGSYFGACYATKNGPKAIKPIFITIAIAMTIKIIIDF